MKNVYLMSMTFIFILMLFSCSQHFTYMPPADAEIESGHFLLFYNELYSTDSEQSESIKPTSIAVDIVQEGKSIISDDVDAGKWNLYPIPEGTYLVNLEIDFLDKPITLKRSFTSKIETVNALNVDFWRVEPVKMKTDVQTKKALYIGKTVSHILNVKREEKPLTFEDVQRFDAKK